MLVDSSAYPAMTAALEGEIMVTQMADQYAEREDVPKANVTVVLTVDLRDGLRAKI